MKYCQSNTFLGCILTLQILLLQNLVKTQLTSKLFKWKTGGYLLFWYSYIVCFSCFFALYVLFATFAGSWGECMGTRCGPGGSQLRSVFCENQALYYKTIQYNCNTEKPPDKRECFKVSGFTYVFSYHQKCQKYIYERTNLLSLMNFE